jgi:hypothetical protein
LRSGVSQIAHPFGDRQGREHFFHRLAKALGEGQFDAGLQLAKARDDLRIEHGSALPIEMTFERVEALAPELAVGFEPAVEHQQGPGLDPIEAALGVLTHAEQARVAHKAQVLGDAGLADRQGVAEFAHRTLPFTQKIEDLTATGISEESEGVIHE